MPADEHSPVQNQCRGVPKTTSPCAERFRKAVFISTIRLIFITGILTGHSDVLYKHTQSIDSEFFPVSLDRNCGNAEPHYIFCIQISMLAEGEGGGSAKMPLEQKRTKSVRR